MLGVGIKCETFINYLTISPTYIWYLDVLTSPTAQNHASFISYFLQNMVVKIRQSHIQNMSQRNIHICVHKSKYAKLHTNIMFYV